MTIKLFIIIAIAISVNCNIFPGTSCLKQPAGKQWFLRHMTNPSVYYQCIKGKPIRKHCYRIFCACIGPKCLLAEADKMRCSIGYKCPALTAVAKPDSCVGSPCEHKGLCRTVRQSGGRTNVTCHCRSGYYGNKCEQDACFPDNCMGGICRRLPFGQYTCRCNRGYAGKYCEIDECATLKCVPRQGYCKRYRNRKSICRCRGGYSGTSCEIDVCAAKPCQNNGYCSRRNVKLRYKCYCRRGYTGINCEIRMNAGSCSRSRCKNQSTCKPISNGHLCTCGVGYYGRTCEKDYCSPSPCQHGGSCSRMDKDYECSCKVGFLGKSCEIDSCKPSPCRNSGTCSGIKDGYQCDCLMGYSGKVCQIDGCGINRCRNGGSCLRTANSYECTCMGGYHGKHCQQLDVTMKPYDPKAYFKCQYGYNLLSNQTGGLKDEEACRTWCYIREDHISQTVRRGCWYPGLYNSDPVLYAEPINGCGFFSDNLKHTDTGNDKVYCFCKSMEGLCNAGNIETVLKELPLIQRLV